MSCKLNEKENMKSIEDLPPEILMKIFKYLTSEDRRVASVVCCYWSYEIWMASTFDYDRTLNFDCCELKIDKPPIKVFINTQREYKYLIFGSEARFCDDLGENFLNNKLNGLRSIEFAPFFNYDQFFSHTQDFLKRLNQLKELKLNVHAWQATDNVFRETPKSLEKFTLNFLLANYDKVVLNSFKSLIWNMSNLKELNLECQTLTDDMFDFITTITLPVLTNLKLNVDLDSYENIMQLRCPNLKDLFFVIESSQLVLQLNELLSNFPSVTTVKLHTYKIMPQCTNAHLIKYLKVTDINCGMDYVRPLQFLTELEELDLTYYFKSVAQGNCFFAHDPYLNLKLKRLRLCGFNNNDLISLMCFENLVKSFPNLESLIMDMPLQSQHLQMINQNFTKLKCLDIRNTDVDSKFVPPLKYFVSLSELHLEQYIITNETLQEWPEMSHLRILSLKLDHNVSLESFQKMIQNVSGVEKLFFNHTSTIDDDLIKIVADNCKRLKKITVMKCQKTNKLTLNSVEYLRKCRYLKKINFPFITIKNCGEM